MTFELDGGVYCVAPATANVALPLLCVKALNVAKGLFPPTSVMRPDTMTYNTAASTTVMATIRMVAITGDTAASSFLMTVFIVYVLLVVASARGPRGVLGRASIAAQRVELVRTGCRRQGDVVDRPA